MGYLSQKPASAHLWTSDIIRPRLANTREKSSMLHSRRAITLGLSGVAAAGTGIAGGARGDVPVYAVHLQSSLNKPVFVGSPPGDPNHLFMVEQGTGGSAR